MLLFAIIFPQVNSKTYAEENGLNYDKVLKATCFLTEIENFAVFNEIYAEFFTLPYPARSVFAVKALPKNAKIEVEIIAQK